MVKTLTWIVTYAAWGAAVLLTGNAVRLAVPHIMRAEGRTTPVALPPAIPYTIVLKNLANDGKGHSLEGQTQTFAVRRDGARVLRETGQDPDGRFVTRKIHLSGGLRIEVDDVAERRSTEWERDDVGEVQDPRSECTTNGLGQVSHLKIAAHEAINGLKTVRLSGPRFSVWYVPELNCAMVKNRMAFGDGESVNELQSLKRGEPDTTLFGVPSSYQEVVPSVLHHMIAGSSEALHTDKQYEDHQTH